MKTILITGSRSGIIKKVIDNIKNENYNILATTHTKKEAKSLKKIYQNNKNIKTFKLDITKEKDIENIKKYNIDILICNAAISYGGSLTQIDIKKVRENFEVNVFSNLNIIQKCLEQMIKRNNGKIIIMSSLASIIPINFIGSYSSTKASLVKIAETLKNEIKILEKNIKICLIEPGIYLTGFNKFMFENKYDNNDKYFKKHKQKIIKQEQYILKFLGQDNFKPIVKQITKAIKCENKKFIYRAPLLQVIGAKIYSIIKQ